MKRWKRTLALLFALVMTFSLVMNSVVYADDKEEDDKKAAVRAQIAEVQAQIDAKKKELDNAKSELDKAKSDTKNAKAKLQAAEQQSVVLAEQIELIEEQIELLNENIEAVELAEKDQYDLFCRQVRQEEERGTLSYWSVLFKASGFDDLLSRIDFINEIMEYDQQIMENLQGIRAELKDNRTDLETQEAELDEAHAQQEKLAAQYAELYKDYKQTEADLQALYDEAVAEEAALEKAKKDAEKMAIELGITGGSSGGYIWPVKVSPIYITSKFGPRKAPTAGASTIHNGIDIGVQQGTPVYAAKGGTVTTAALESGAGNHVVVTSGSGYFTSYMHLSRISVSVGTVVAQGELIGYSGGAVGTYGAGTSTGAHLDFRIMEAGVYKDPLSYLSGYTLWC